MRPPLVVKALAAALALGACTDGAPAPASAGDIATDPPEDAQETIAPGVGGLYQGDPLAGPDLDPTEDPF